MALTRANTTVTWATANTGTVPAGGNLTSDAISLDITCVDSSISLSATSGATDNAYNVEFYAVWASDGGTAYDTADSSHATLLTVLEITAVNTTYQTTVQLPPVPQNVKILAINKNTGTDSVTVSAIIEELRSA